MRTLHVAALPFPSPQGTQALLHAMLSALAAAGHDTHLLCYAHGVGNLDTTYTVHRAPGRGRSLRSGPAFEKLWLDLRLARALARLARSLAPDAIIAHHVEAAACATLAAPGPQLFVAHTSLREELPSYFAGWSRRAWERAGHALDGWLIRHATRSCAVSPLLASLLTRSSARTVAPLPLPWFTPPPITPAERRRAREALGIAPASEVALYAGNLDPYQGLEPLREGFARALKWRPHLRWLIATEASHGAFARELRRARVADRVSFLPLAGESARRVAHAAADVALVPRRSAGGLPIKLLDACARGVPVVAARIALAEQPLAAFCEAVEGGSPEAWCAALVRILSSPAAAQGRALAARACIGQDYSSARFVSALIAEVRSARGRAAGGARRP